jgi:hypothetical protein
MALFSMRSVFMALALMGSLEMALITEASAQTSRQQRDQDRSQDEDEGNSKKEDEWNERQLDLKARRADGPCPFVKVLYDAARFHEFKDDREAMNAAQWTGEIQGVSSDCAYRSDEPISVEMLIGFSLGRGPEAEGETKNFPYWVAVTEKDRTVLARQDFTLPVTFAPGETVKNVQIILENIVIPRAAAQVSGSNFEILVGFEVDERMIAFNRDGKHFRFVVPPPVKR